MCGLYGYITKKEKTLTPKQREIREGIVRGLALVMQERGTHSTGIACVNGRNNVEIAKKALTASDFIKQPEFKKLLSKNNRILIGHTRLATVGARTDENSHPFHIGSIVGCHNGRVSDYATVYPEATVDSEAIFYTLNKHKNNVKSSFKKLRGMFAVTWLNQYDLENLFFMVNGNPLFLIKIPEIETYFYCSTYQALSSIVGSRFGLKGRTIWQPKTDIVYKMSTDLVVSKTLVKLQTEAEAKKIEEKAKESKYKKLKREFEERKKKAGWVQPSKPEEGFVLVPNNKEYKAPLCDDDEIVDSEIIVPKRSIEEYKKIMNLSFGEMTTIIKGVGYGGCMMCEADIDIVEGFMWNSITKQLLCMRCATFFPDYQELLYIGEEDYLEIENEFSEHEARYE